MSQLGFKAKVNFFIILIVRFEQQVAKARIFDMVVYDLDYKQKSCPIIVSYLEKLINIANLAVYSYYLSISLWIKGCK